MSGINIAQRGFRGFGRTSSSGTGVCGGTSSSSPRVIKASPSRCGAARYRYAIRPPSSSSSSGTHERLRRRQQSSGGSREVLRRALMPPSKRPSLRWLNFRPTPSRLSNMSMAKSEF
ncbi:hypothetical protein LINPERHAP2_LOCUS19814 [Linum perenne]